MRDATEDYWKSLLVELKGEVIYAVGGGLAVDAAKYLAAAKRLPLVCIPTAISVDAFLTWASGVRQEGSVRYLVTKPPDQLIVDLKRIGSGPPPLRAAGICDVLSIATGLWDWNYAHERNANPPGMDYLPYAAHVAAAILEGSLDCAEAAGRGDPAGLKQLLDCLALEVQLCNQLGHSRPEEGSEHYFAYAVENLMGKGLPHGDLVGPGILLMAQLQGQETAPLRRALEACHIPLNRIPPEIVRETLRGLPDFCRRHNLPHGLAHDLNDSMIGAISGVAANWSS
ncbi:iron-containing alcohol dehydrogenase [Candidatus Sumerlaeota bacterium]|nr:iron-containing alcohol dehydrogenase [Candidatus Sumerlaeota bacterium]